MKIRILGCRGSYPTAKKENALYGQSTSCVEVIHDGRRLILDAGTGILGLNFSDYFDLPRIDIFLTHLHMDHIQGLGFFKPLFVPGKEVHIWGPGGSTHSLKNRLNRYLSPPLFPLPLRDLPCELEIHELADSDFSIDGLNIKTEFVIHPGPTIGYRIERGEKIFVYIPDHEPMIGSQELYSGSRWISGSSLCAQADVLIHDAQYTEEEYESRYGWGHSSVKHMIELAEHSKVKTVYMFHHDPDHSDAFLEDMVTKAQKKVDDPLLSVKLASQGLEIEI